MNSAKTEVVYVVQRTAEYSQWRDCSNAKFTNKESAGAEKKRRKGIVGNDMRYQIIERKTTVEERVIE